MFGRELLEINEMFGPTVQGEGAAAGRHCLFLRVANCNLECKWCDTAYTWAFSKNKAEKTISGTVYNKDENLKRMTPEDVLTRLGELWDIRSRPLMIVVSGGEPLMQQKKLVPVIKQLHEWGNEVHIETAGTIVPDGDFTKYVTQFNVSPKLQHSGNRLTKRYRPEALAALAGDPKVWWKFVVMPHAGMDGEDFHEIDELVKEFNINPHRVMIMPEGNSIDGNIEGAQSWSQRAIDRGYGISFRTHVLLWPKVDRGR